MHIKDLIEYKNWADNVYLEHISALSEAQFTELVPTINKSVQELLLHIFASYLGDYHLITDMDWSNLPDFENLNRSEIINGIRQCNENMVEFILNNPVDELITYNEDGYDEAIKTNAENVLMNFVEHSSYHRGQIALLLRYHGVESIEMTNYHPYIWKMKQ